MLIGLLQVLLASMMCNNCIQCINVRTPVTPVSAFFCTHTVLDLYVDLTFRPMLPIVILVTKSSQQNLNGKQHTSGTQETTNKVYKTLQTRSL